MMMSLYELEPGDVILYGENTYTVEDIDSKGEGVIEIMTEGDTILYGDADEQVEVDEGGR